MKLRWLDGRLVDEADPAVQALPDPSETGEPVGCTSARIHDGRARHAAYHARRLSRDAQTLGRGDVDPARLERIWLELGRAAFGDGDGIIRVEMRKAAEASGTSLLAIPRPIGHENDAWTALSCPTQHAGPSRYSGIKLVDERVYREARAYSATFGVDESLLFDAEGRLVEGARSNVLVVAPDGRLCSPDLALGAVDGVALRCVRDALPELAFVRIRVQDLERAREVIALNAVRGARPITRLDERDVGDGQPGPWAGKLDALLLADAC